MGGPSHTRRLVALVAAYVVALQALLLPLSVASAPFAGTSLCAAATSGAAIPGGDQSGGPCAGGCGMLCCAPAVLSSATRLAIVLPVVRAVAPSALRYAAVRAASAGDGPQQPRAPPVA
jgi:hypothetical protein